MARDGIADVTYVSPGYQPGRFPIIDAGNLPFTMSNAKAARRHSTSGIASTPAPR